MAKSLVFQWGTETIEFQMQKVDRAKLYGFKETEVLDEQDRPCELATLAEDGRTIVGKGGTGIGYLDADGSWADKSELRPVNLEGDPITPVPSSFSAPIELSQRVEAQEYLDHNIRSVYELQSDSISADLVDELNQGAIFKFDYSFRGGLEADAGFLVSNDEGVLFLAVGDATKIEFVGIHQAAAVVPDDIDGDDSGDLMDFGMI